MSILDQIIHKIIVFEKEPQKIGLSQLKQAISVGSDEPSISNKDVKLSDLMRRT